jgi:hypothetical protein
MLKEYQETILQLLGQLELDVSNLYKIFGEKFPKYKALWDTLSQEEIEHADRVKMLYDLAKENKVIFDEKLTKTYTVKKVLEIIKDAQVKTLAGQINIINALSISRDLEQSIIEKEFYNYFAGKDSETRMLINSIKKDTLDHQSMVRNAWEEERKIALNLPRKP